MRRLFTFLLVSLCTTAAVLWWVADGDLSRAWRPVATTAAWLMAAAS